MNSFRSWSKIRFLIVLFHTEDQKCHACSIERDTYSGKISPWELKVLPISKSCFALCQNKLLGIIILQKHFLHQEECIMSIAVLLILLWKTFDISYQILKAIRKEGIAFVQFTEATLYPCFINHSYKLYINIRQVTGLWLHSWFMNQWKATLSFCN